MAKPWENREGYHDPTAYHTIQQEDQLENQCNEALRFMKKIAALYGFEVIHRIALKDRRTGREFR